MTAASSGTNEMTLRMYVTQAYRRQRSRIACNTTKETDVTGFSTLNSMYLNALVQLQTERKELAGKFATILWRLARQWQGPLMNYTPSPDSIEMYCRGTLKMYTHLLVPIPEPHLRLAALKTWQGLRVTYKDRHATRPDQLMSPPRPRETSEETNGNYNRAKAFHNRVIKAVPKAMTFKRNYNGRVHDSTP
uniref:Uncharacterized protein n=1 Tax=Branchiostoma floridae TaxID=7739 RepID=C3ZTR7_BRAFL|eukprot:XP_002588054.1 hypothetical protein BRAFLDRAFT_83035 [Branchiostoma floridae]